MPMNTSMAAIQELDDNNGRAAADSRALRAPFPEALTSPRPGDCIRNKARRR